MVIRRWRGISRRAVHARAGWSLIELLIVIAVIGILLALLLSAVQAIRESARRVQCANQLRQLTIACAAHEAAWHRFPPGWCEPAMTLWSALLLPYLEQDVLYQTIDLNGPWKVNGVVPHPGNIAALRTWIRGWQCPSGTLPETQWDDLTQLERVPCSYLACASGTNDRESGQLPWCGMNAWHDPNSGQDYPASDGIFYMNSRTRTAEVVDGLSHTLLIGESIPDQTLWGIDLAGNSQKIDHWFLGSAELYAYPDISSYGSSENSECLGSTACPLNSIRDLSAPIDMRELSFGSSHPAGVNFGLADGQVRWVATSTSPEILRALGTRAGSEPSGD